MPVKGKLLQWKSSVSQRRTGFSSKKKIILNTLDKKNDLDLVWLYHSDYNQSYSKENL